MLFLAGAALTLSACRATQLSTEGEALTQSSQLQPTPTFEPGTFPADQIEDTIIDVESPVVETPAVGAAVAADDAAFVQLQPGADLQAEVINYPEGTRFRLAPGIYRPDELQPRSGNWFIGGEGVVFDGGNTIRFAVRNKDRVTDVVLEAIEVRNYVPQRAFGAIDMTTYRWRNVGDEGFETTDYGPRINWRLSDMWVHNNDGEGIVVGSGVFLENVRSTDNTWLGIGGHGDGVIIDGGVLARNSRSALDEGQLNWHSGGLKITVSKNVVIRNLHVHDNYGLGIWLDISVQNALVEHNLVENNAGIGIFYEISYNGEISNNVVRNNAQLDDRGWFWPAGILVTTSTDVAVVGNHVSGSPVGIAVADTRITRNDEWLGTPPNVRGPQPYRAANIGIIENTICDVDRVGVGREVGLDDREVLDTTVFSRNTYGTITTGLTADPQRNVSVADWRAEREPSALSVPACPAPPVNWQAPPG